MPVLGLKYFLKHGLKKIHDLPPKTLSEMKFALGLNFDNKEGFIKAMSKSGIEKERLGSIWDSEVHEAVEMDKLDQAQKLQIMAGDETVSVDKIFSRDDLKKMSIDVYEQNRDKILGQVASGLIK